MSVEQDVTIVGKVTTAFGIKGWVKIYSHTDPMENILGYKNWLLKINGQWQSFKLKSGKPQGKGIVAAFEGIDDRDAALAISQADIAIPSSQLPELGSDEFYWFQLEGLQVITLDGQLLGKVSRIFNTGAPHDVLDVRGCEGSFDRLERLIPYVDDVVQSVDLDKGIIQVDWQPDY